MAFSNVQATESIQDQSVSPRTWTHTQSGLVPNAVIVAINHGTTATDRATAVTYGGVAMTKQVTQTDTAGEPGLAQLWFLGSGIPSGNQTVSVTLSPTAAEGAQFVSVTMSNDGVDTTVHATATNVQDQNEANPSVTPAKGGNVAVGFATNYYGGGAPGVAQQTLLHDHDFTAFASSFQRETSLTSSTDQALAWNQLADDEAVAALTVKAVAGGGGPATGLRTLAMLGVGV